MFYLKEIVTMLLKNGEVIIVDEFTGRMMPGRRWSEGLHQAVEAKEGVGVQKESRTLATITFQNYFRLYEKLSGMTGTAQTSAEEFHKVYSLEVVVIPTNKPMIREDLPDRVYKNEVGKFRAIVREIKERNKTGQPILVGTVSIAKNEMLSAMLQREGIKHSILNAKQHEREGELHAQAGQLGAVTVATNMAGRGVDIILGGNPPDGEEAKKVRELGGLHMLGTERHEARRIDDQLRGRAGRQGDPGSSQFFVSTEDDLVRVFGGDRLKNIMERLGVGEDDVIENKFVSNAIGQAQSKIEGHYFDARKYTLEYDDVMNKHRQAVYQVRKDALFSESSKEAVLDYLSGYIQNLVQFHTQGHDYQWNLKEIAESIKTIIPTDQDVTPKLEELAKSRNPEDITNYLNDSVLKLYELKEKDVGPDKMRQLEKLVLLRTVDELWMDHIETMEYLRDSVRLRAYGQRDPLVEYKIEGQNLFNKLMDSIQTQVASLIFKVNFIDQPKKVEMQESRPDAMRENAMQKEAQKNIQQPVKSEGPKVGRNDPCPCGAKKPDGRPVKYKHCHGK